MEAEIETQTVASIGSYLRELRARRGTSLEELGRVTRVAPRYLEALEADAHEALPAPVFTRGFIRAYCQAIGQSPDEALALYDGREVAPMPRLTVGPLPPTTRESEKAQRTRGAILVSAGLVLVLGGALFAVALIIQPRDRGERTAAASRPESKTEAKAVSTSPSKPEPTASAPAASAVTPATPPASSPATSPVAGPPPPPTAPPTPRPVPTPVMVTPKTAAAPVGSVQVVSPENPTPANTVQAAAPPNLDVLAGVSSPYRLVARTTEATWIRVRTDDGRNTEESIPAGEVREYVSNRPFILTVGNAAGVSFELNGRPVPQLGARGSVIPRLVLPPEAR